MSLRRAFKAFFGNPDWLKKSALGMLGMLVPYVGSIVVMGFGLEYARGVAWRDDDKLPEWGQLERYLKTGFGAFVVSLGYSLPVMIVLTIIGVVPFLMFINSPSAEPWMLVFVIIFGVLSLPVALVWSAIAQAGMLRFIAYGKIGEGFRFKEIFSTTVSTKGPFWGALWRVWVMSLGLSAIMMVGYGVTYGSIIAAAFSGSDEAALAALPMMYCGQFVLMFVLMAASVLMQLISFHVWGQYLAIAYPEPVYLSAETVGDPVAQYGAGHMVLPTAPGQPPAPGQPAVFEAPAAPGQTAGQPPVEE